MTRPVAPRTEAGKRLLAVAEDDGASWTEIADAILAIEAEAAALPSPEPSATNDLVEDLAIYVLATPAPTGTEHENDRQRLIARLDEWTLAAPATPEPARSGEPDDWDPAADYPLRVRLQDPEPARSGEEEPPPPPRHDPTDHDCRGGVPGDRFPL